MNGCQEAGLGDSHPDAAVEEQRLPGREKTGLYAALCSPGAGRECQRKTVEEGALGKEQVP